MEKQNETPYYLIGVTSVLFAIADVNTYNCNIKLLFQLPMTCIKIWGIFINNWTYGLIVALILFFIEYNKNKAVNNLKHPTFIPVIMSIFTSIFFITGVGNLFNKLYKRALIQFIIGVIFCIMHFYLVITRWSLNINIYFNTRLWSISLIMLIYRYM